MRIADAQSLVVIAVAGVALGAVAWVALKGARGAARSLATGTVDVVAETLAGTVEGIGESVGVPTTDKEKGRADIARGDWWQASFDLPAGDFLGAVWDKVTGGDGTGGISK